MMNPDLDLRGPASDRPSFLPWLGGLAATLFALMCSFPFVEPWHNAPWYTYYGEWQTMLLGLGIAGSLLYLPRPTRWGWSTLWFAGFAVALLVQTAVLRPGYWGPGLTAAAMLGLCAVLAQTVLQARALWGSQRVLTVMAIGLVLGGLVTAAVGWIQRLDMTSDFAGIVLVHPVDPRQAIGNIGQRNLYGHYLMWAGIAAVYLFARFPRWSVPLFLLMSWMAFEGALTESRTTLGYYACWLAVAGVAAVARPTPLQKRFALASLWAVALGVVMQFVGADIVQWIAQQLGVPIQARAGIDRFAAQGGTLGRRPAEWQKALMTFREHPFFGVGWGYYAGESFRLHGLPQFVRYKEDVLWTHSHNGVLQILAEVGAVGFAFLAGLAALLLRGLRRWQNDVAIVAFPLLGVSLIHSQMEYPLWYLHYLALFAVFLALLEPEPELAARRPRQRLRLPLWTAALIVTLLHPFLYEAVIRPVPDARRAEHVRWLSRVAERVPLFDYLAEDSILNSAPVVRDPPFYDDVTRRLVGYRPFPDALFWRMCTLVRLGREEAVPEMMRQSYAAYPGYAKAFPRDLKRYGCTPTRPDAIPARSSTDD